MSSKILSDELPTPTGKPSRTGWWTTLSRPRRRQWRRRTCPLRCAATGAISTRRAPTGIQPTPSPSPTSAPAALPSPRPRSANSNARPTRRRRPGAAPASRARQTPPSPGRRVML
ncbi:hypothetical protein PG990_005204 [Apiospora arundinis]